MQDAIADVLAHFLADRHTFEKCPCRKHHHVANKPTPPDAPPNTGKQAGRIRQAIEKLKEARDLGDENETVKAQRDLDFHTHGEFFQLRDYRSKYIAYDEAMSGVVT